MDQIQYETRRQCHLTEMVSLEEKMQKKKQAPAAPKQSIQEEDEEDILIREEEEKSKRLYQEMVSDIAASGLNMPPSFLKVQKNNESKFTALFYI